MKSKTFNLYLIFIFLLVSTHVQAAASEKPGLNVVRLGEAVKIKPVIALKIQSQIITLFRTCSIDTSQSWLREAWEKQGKSIPDIWNDIRSKSYFSVSQPDVNNISEIMISINEEKYSLGAVMSKSVNGEILGHIKCSGHQHLKLICMPEVQKFLPRHYLEFKHYQRNCKFAAE